MFQSRSTLLLTRAIALTVLSYGLLLIASTLLHQARLHPGRDIDAFIISLPLLFGLSYVYLGNLLLRRKYNAWLTAVALSVLTIILNGLQLLRLLASDIDYHMALPWIRVVGPFIILLLLVVARADFRVKSDARSFQQAARISVILLLAAFLYGVGGFMLLDTHDFHQHIPLTTAVHQTVDQFGLTESRITAHSRRARLFLDSLPVISIGALAYAAVSFFQPLRIRLEHREEHRQQAEQLLRDFPSDIDDYFKLWPHDKLYFFDTTGRSFLAYHVVRGVALVVGDPAGDSSRFPALLQSFVELCFVNDWLPGFVHTSDKHRRLYEGNDLRLQKIGEEAVVDIDRFQTISTDKYFRQIRNRFIRQGYKVEVLQPPHGSALIERLRTISEEWLQRPGREERGFMLGYFDAAYLQQGPLAVLKDAAEQIQAFINLIPTFDPETANYDLLRGSANAPGNSNDFLVVAVIEYLRQRGIKSLNLGLCPLAGLDEKSENAGLIDSALRFAYSNGDRFYSFSGLRRFKAKFEPDWQNRYITYPGGIRNFTRIVTALNRAMKVKASKAK